MTCPQAFLCGNGTRALVARAGGTIDDLLQRVALCASGLICSRSCFAHLARRSASIVVRGGCGGLRRSGSHDISAAHGGSGAGSTKGRILGCAVEPARIIGMWRGHGRLIRRLAVRQLAPAARLAGRIGGSQGERIALRDDTNAEALPRCRSSLALEPQLPLPLQLLLQRRLVSSAALGASAAGGGPGLEVHALLRAADHRSPGRLRPCTAEGDGRRRLVPMQK
mmetsp:Transcript_123594/g.357450  ORF Transcript_123594/g.357450 Transcript_123594/m.357450 type:complete len:224 (-) Transcript_123594:103-774(-)